MTPRPFRSFAVSTHETVPPPRPAPRRADYARLLRLAAWRAPLPKQIGAGFVLSLAGATLVLIVLFSLVFTRLVERPMRRMLTSLLLRKRAALVEKAKAE